MPTLIERILTGDEHAVVELYTTYSPKLLAYLKKKLPKEEDAQEIVNDVFFEAIDGLPLFQEKSTILTWLYRIAHNKIVDFYRKRKIKSFLLSQAPFLEIVAKDIHNPEFEFEKNRIRERIESCLHNLSGQYRSILSMHYEQDIPVKDIAEILNLSFSATQSLLFRARQSFKQTYERE